MKLAGLAPLLLSTWTAIAGATGDAPLPPSQLAAAAGDGSLVFLTTHAVATRGSDQVRDANADQRFLADCARQRNLDENGRAHARAFGQALLSRNIRFARVAASPYCRARETAELALPGRGYEIDADLRSTCFANAAAVRERRGALLRQLATPRAGNVLLITHFCNVSTFARATLQWCGLRLEPGTSIVYRAGASPPRALGCIPAETWREWATPER